MSRYNCDYIDDGYKERKVGAARVPRQGHLETLPPVKMQLKDMGQEHFPTNQRCGGGAMVKLDEVTKVILQDIQTGEIVLSDELPRCCVCKEPLTTQSEFLDATTSTSWKCSACIKLKPPSKNKKKFCFIKEKDDEDD